MTKPIIEIRLPQIDENVVEYTIGRWLKTAGDMVEANEPICEVETDKVTMEVVAEMAGQLTELLAAEGDQLRPGDLLAMLDPQAGVDTCRRLSPRGDPGADD